MRSRYTITPALFPDMTPAVKYLLIANACLFALTLLFSRQIIAIFGLTPSLVWRGMFWQPVSYLFLHGGIFHLLFNMLVLWMFGTTLEATWGTRRFVQYYALCGTGAGILNAIVTPASMVPIVGSSGAVYGLLLAFGVLFPNQLIYFWGIFPIRAKYFVLIIGAIEFFTSVTATRSRVAHVVHLGGMLFGLAYLKLPAWKAAVSVKRQAKRRERHLRVVWDREKERQRLQEEIDSLLDKAGKDGIGTLTEAEHARFRDLSRKIEELENRR